jgi:N-acetylmuramoyl-L-alanine amidase
MTSGTEVLYYHTSQKGKQMAEILQNHLVTYLGLKDRGIKPKSAEDRGGYLLRYTNAPCVIAEPFFIDNDQDLSVAMLNKSGLADAYIKAIDEIANTL